MQSFIYNNRQVYAKFLFIIIGKCMQSFYL